jgi:chitin disaccharide deacetylase
VKRVVLCADDFGMTPAVDAGILHLLGLGRLTAVSCLADGPAFEADLAALLPFRGDADLGLHFDLTDGSGGGKRSTLLALLLRAYSGAIDATEVRRCLEAQLDRFERLAGHPPDFVDGHQHVHQFPRVRDALVDVLRRRYGSAPPWVRCTVSSRPSGAKARLVAALGGRALRAMLEQRGLPYNRDFGGVYALDPGAAYGALMKRWLERIDDGGLILCHPGEPGVVGEDPIALARTAELRYLESSRFTQDCQAVGVGLARFARR